MGNRSSAVISLLPKIVVPRASLSSSDWFNIRRVCEDILCCLSNFHDRRIIKDVLFRTVLWKQLTFKGDKYDLANKYHTLKNSMSPVMSSTKYSTNIYLRVRKLCETNILFIHNCNNFDKDSIIGINLIAVISFHNYLSGISMEDVLSIPTTKYSEPLRDDFESSKLKNVLDFSNNATSIMDNLKSMYYELAGKQFVSGLCNININKILSVSSKAVFGQAKVYY